ncbi:glutaredoxin domain-containing protein [Pseudoduganella sp. HUAS MS19]
MIRFCIITALMLVSSPGMTQTLYKFVGQDGKIVYSDRPPANGKIEKTLHTQSLPNTALPSATAGELARLRKEAKPTTSPNAGTVMFSAAWCGYCRQAKAYLAQRGVAYKEVNIDTPEGKTAFAKASTENGVPYLLKDGEGLRGYSKEAYDEFFARR